MLIDATKKNCKGVITELEKAMAELKEGDNIETIVYGVPNRMDVYAWARRKGHTIEKEQRSGANFRITVIKGPKTS
jgi:TusA-related sulfurtransferase